METATQRSAEIIIVGAGLAGTLAAAVLGRCGRRVILVDPYSSYPPVFKAEKVDQDQARGLRELGLLDHLLPHAGGVRHVRIGYYGRTLKVVSREQYGLSYQDMVNVLRARLPESVECRVGRVEAIARSNVLQRVKLADGPELSCRLVVLASGVSDGLLATLGLRRRLLQKDQSAVFGFTIAAADSRPFNFDSVTYYVLDPSARIDYLTLFRFRETMRANLFAFRAATDPWAGEFIREPDRMLRKYFPGLECITGAFQVVSKIEFGRADLYRVEGPPPPGVVLIGDVFQSVCPSTGMGLTKILADVVALGDRVPHWFSTPGMGSEKIAEFYKDPRKLATDARALRRASHQRKLVTDTSWRWRTHRLLLQLRWKLGSAIRWNSGKLTGNDTARTDRERLSGPAQQSDQVI